jgi:putative oxidoreductase
LVLGLLTPIAAAVICSVMLVALTVHIKNGFFAQNGGYEYALVLGVAGLSFGFTGPGSLSLDALLGNHFSGTFWGIAALLVGALGGAFSLSQRRTTPGRQTTTAHTV